MRGMYVGGDQSGDLDGATFRDLHVCGHGALGDFYCTLWTDEDLKMGDTPTVLYLLKGDVDDPTSEHWGGMFGATGHGPNYWWDLTDAQYREGSYNGAKTVNVWREAYLRDWQKRMDWADVAANAPPIITEVAPDPDTAFCTTEYARQLSLDQGTPMPSWSVVQGPPGTDADTTGFVNGWRPACSDIGTLFTFEIRATNSEGSDTETWEVAVRSVADLDDDGDVDQEDFGVFQACLSGTGVQYPPGCGDADLHLDGDVDEDDWAIFQSCMAGPDVPPGC